MTTRQAVARNASAFATHNRSAPAGRALPRALVAFSGQTELAWLRLLRPGFRHCFAVVEILGGVNAAPGGQGGSWVLYNPLSNGTQLAVWTLDNEETLRAWLRLHDYVVVETRARPLDARLFGWRPYTCVEAVKRVLGLHAPGVFTPWQLYRRLKKTDNRNIILDSRGWLGYNSF